MQIETQVNEFIGNLKRLVYETALKAIRSATGAKCQTGTRRQVSARRSTEALTSMTEQLYQAVCERPGESMKAFGQTLQCEPRELFRCMHRLIAQGRVKKAGERQNTRYFPVDAPAKRSREAR
ncbi:MAG: winged helix-turn-helix domain-containing protein [Deltaproteobacteria bacterium]|nr:winged helix-turn-helix domain-containing protein [Deltaproteobacteria bacterium]